MTAQPAGPIDARPSPTAPPAPGALPPLSAAPVVRAVIWGQPVFFTIANPKDHIQSEHRAGRFYENEELEIIRQWFRPGTIMADIGSNVGNHTLFALLFLRAAKVIPFEPNPAAIAVLTSNLALNGVIDRCDLSHLGCGLSDTARGGLSVVAPARNLGGGRLVEGGDLTVIRGDDALADSGVGFLKIDVEGMEVEVLAGLSETIARHRPRIFIEVQRSNSARLADWAKATGYVRRATYRRYPGVENILLTHPDEPLPPGHQPSR